MPTPDGNQKGYTHETGGGRQKFEFTYAHVLGETNKRYTRLIRNSPEIPSLNALSVIRPVLLTGCDTNALFCLIRALSSAGGDRSELYLNWMQLPTDVRKGVADRAAGAADLVSAIKTVASLIDEAFRTAMTSSRIPALIGRR